jgi:hypothetical protein
MQKTLKTSAWRAFIATLLLLGISLAALIVVLIRSGPEYVAGVLSRVLGQRVQIESINVSFDSSLHVELEGLRVFDPSDAQIPRFEVRWARASQSWPRILAGQFVPLDWALERPVLRIRPGTGAAFQLRPRLPLVALSIQDGTVEWQQPRGEPVFLRDLELVARRIRLSSTLGGEATADLTRGDLPVGRAAARFTASRGELGIQAKFVELELAALPLGNLPLSSGRAQGVVAAQVREDSVEGSADFSVTHLELGFSSLRRPIASNDVRIQGEGSWRDGVLRLKPESLQLDDLEVSGELTVTSGEERRVRGSLALAAFEAGRPDERLQWLRGADRTSGGGRLGGRSGDPAGPPAR